MKKEKETTISSDCRVVHVQVINGTQADIYEIGKAMQEFSKKLPFRLEALVTNDSIKLNDVDSMIRELVKLRKQLHVDGGFK